MDFFSQSVQRYLEIQNEKNVVKISNLTPLKTHITKLVTEEADYVFGLEQIVNFYQKKMREEDLINVNDEATIFMKFDELLQFHTTLMEELKGVLREPEPGEIGRIFLQHVSKKIIENFSHTNSFSKYVIFI